MANSKTVAGRVGLFRSLILLLILGMVNGTFKSHLVLKDETNPVRSVCTYMPIPYLNDVVVNICVDFTKPISMASVNDSVNVKHGRILADGINTS